MASSEGEESVVFLAVSRQKRANAGSHMARLLNEEEEDEFYSSTYGGFKEEAEDTDYDSRKSDSDDVIDSDFDIDEADDVKSDFEEDEHKIKKHSSGVYKEPKIKKQKVKKLPNKRVTANTNLKREIWDLETNQNLQVQERKSKRAATAVKSQATAKREKQREEKNKLMKEMASRKNVPEVRRLTQEELLAEARKTERENMKSLENYYKLELEKKKSRNTKQVMKGPIIRYHSTTMPCMEDSLLETDIIVDGEGLDDGLKKMGEMYSEKSSRSFVMFTDDAVFKEYFSSKKTKPLQRHICPVTKTFAKFFDPLTKTPYATLHAFKLIREAYAQQCDS